MALRYLMVAALLVVGLPDTTCQDFQRVLLDLFDHVGEKISTRRPDQEAFPGGPVVPARDAFSIEERIKPMLTGIGVLARGRVFSMFRKAHMDEAQRVLRLILQMKGNDLELTLAYLRDTINEEMFVFTTSVAVFSHPDLRRVRLPPIEEVLPCKFISSDVVNVARTMDRQQNNASQDPVVIDPDFTGTDLDLEHRLAYWREDIGLNAAHWHWHVVYPANWIPEMNGTRDRKGELFFYFHQQIIARFDVERLSHNLNRIVPYQNFDERIPEGYAPHLSNDISGLAYASRAAGMVLQDLPAEPIHRMRTFYNRVIAAIHQGNYQASNGSNFPFDPVTGIDILGHMVEASESSPNSNFYGSFHNSGHDTISRIHDPDERFKEEMGVMGDSATAMRDPIFYRFHKFVDNTFQELKATLPTYTTDQLNWEGVRVVTVDIQGAVSMQPSQLQTFWQIRNIRLDMGVNFNRQRAVTVRARHLQHEAFTYTINIENNSPGSVRGTVRIFMAPQNNELGRALPLREQRILFMEMDKFPVRLNKGSNVIRRKSSESNVTRATVETYGDLIRDAQQGVPLSQTSYCSCGLPQHLLIPRGKPEGMPFTVFVMVTNAAEDSIEARNSQQCGTAASYCGILNELYPDRRAMGFPFDRPVDPSLANLPSFLTPNMATVDVTIRFRNEVADIRSNGNVFFPEKK